MESATTDQELVKISGRGALVNISVDDGAPLNLACKTLRDRLARDRQLYSHGEVVVDIGKRILSDDDQGRIRKVIEAESGLTIKEFWCDPTVLVRERERISDLMDLHSNVPEQINGREVMANAGPAAADSDITGDDASVAGDTPSTTRQSVSADIVRGTCRAGEVLKFSGNVVVVGNVNPGAQIIAQGDILVFGALRGTAHAGAGGDSTAVILAMSSAAPQLRIGDFLEDEDALDRIAGRRRDDFEGKPIIARVQNRAVRVSPYLRNHSIDHGGNPNER
ncbi:MAG: septum site-determining protein MinC [Chloroflexi bacterium]|nr:septum site-determining protein MinC [Chloroflexota bacterium]